MVRRAVGARAGCLLTPGWFALNVVSLRRGPSATAAAGTGLELLCCPKHSPDFRDTEIQWFVDAPVSCKAHLSGLSVPLGISAAYHSCSYFSSNIN